MDNNEQLQQENRRLRRAVQELSMLNDLARDLGASLDPDKIMSKIVRRALKAVDASQGVVTLVDSSEQASLKTLVRTTSDTAERRPFHLNESMLGWMMINKSPLMLNDPGSDTRFRGVRWDEAIKTMLAAPLMIKSRLTGVLTVYNKRQDGEFTDDDQRLLSIIAAQSAQIVENARLVEEERALTRVKEELRLAHDIQVALQPATSPDIPGYDVNGVSLPARTVGGDYLDFIPIDDRRTALVVGDVSGKGLPASLLMANVQATLRGQADWCESVSECVGRANKLLCRSVRRGNFVTLFYGELDYENHLVRFGNAGHNRPFLINPGTDAIMLEKGGLVLGVKSDFEYAEDEVEMVPGSVLCVYSDGVSEAMNARGEQFSEERLAETLVQHSDKTAAEIRDAVISAIDAFAGGAPQHDDVTVLILKRDS
jgi:sigma-B regulation protein RsbU (phosphoserine phosphatase)